MFKTLIIESSAERRLLLAGRLAESQIEELRKAWRKVKTDLGTREPVVDLKYVTGISKEGEDAILDLMNDGAIVAWRIRGPMIADAA